MLYALCFLLFVIGLYCAVVKKNMVKIVIGIAVMEYAVNLFLIKEKVVAFNALEHFLAHIDRASDILGQAFPDVIEHKID